MTVLVLRALGLGDGLTAIPALRGLRRLADDRPIVLACTHPVGRLLQAYGLVDRLVPTPGLDGPPPGPGLGRHTAVNLHGSGPQSHRLLAAGEPSRLVAFDCPAAGIGGPPWATEPEVARWCRLVDSIAGPVCDPRSLGLGTPGDRAGPVVIHPGAAAAARRWPVGRWATVVRSLTATGHPVVITGGPAERPNTAALTRLAGLPPAADRGGRLELAPLLNLVRNARLVVSGDTGIAHLATATGTPSVTLFGPTSPRLWGPPPGVRRHVVLWHGDESTPGDPHGRSTDPALWRITPAEVLAAARPLLRTR